MNRHQLATLLSWTGDQGFCGRKRLQKVVFFLQEAGCDLGCHYTLHHFGPYSRDVADTCDEMVAAGLIEEKRGPRSGSLHYVYKLTPQIQELVNSTPEPRIQQSQEFGKELIEMDIWQLELGSTILFFHRQNRDWQQALNKACEFKKVSANIAASQSALTLANRVQAMALN